MGKGTAVGVAYWQGPESVEDEKGAALITAAEGWLSQEEMAGLYADQMGVSLDQVDYYRGWAAWRLACISEGVYARYLNGQQGEQDEELDLDEYKTGVEARAERAAAILGV